MFFLFFISFFPSAVIADTSWQEYYGCYLTLEVNEQKVENQGFWNQTQISQDHAWNVRDINGEEIMSHRFIIYADGKNQGKTYDVATAFLDRGIFSEIEGGHLWSYSGKVKSKLDPNLIFSLKHQIEIKRLSLNQIWLRNIIEIENAPQFNSQNDYLLELIPCKFRYKSSGP